MCPFPPFPFPFPILYSLISLSFIHFCLQFLVLCSSHCLLLLPSQLLLSLKVMIFIGGTSDSQQRKCISNSGFTFTMCLQCDVSCGSNLAELYYIFTCNFMWHFYSIDTGATSCTINYSKLRHVFYLLTLGLCQRETILAC